MDEKYFPEKIEEKWQRRWEEAGAFEVEAGGAREVCARGRVVRRDS